jgi:hypothetical protein
MRKFYFLSYQCSFLFKTNRDWRTGEEKGSSRENKDRRKRIEERKGRGERGKRKKGKRKTGYGK